MPRPAAIAAIVLILFAVGLGAYRYADGPNRACAEAQSLGML